MASAASTMTLRREAQKVASEIVSVSCFRNISNAAALRGAAVTNLPSANLPSDSTCHLSTSTTHNILLIPLALAPSLTPSLVSFSLTRGFSTTSAHCLATSSATNNLNSRTSVRGWTRNLLKQVRAFSNDVKISFKYEIDGSVIGPTEANFNRTFLDAAKEAGVEIEGEEDPYLALQLINMYDAV
jgi:hypothetical protein